MTHHIGTNQQPFTGDPWTCPQCTGSKDPNMPACDQCRTAERKREHARRVIGAIAALGQGYGRKPDPYEAMARQIKAAGRAKYGANNWRVDACAHDWQPTANWLIDRCAKCGEERA